MFTVMTCYVGARLADRQRLVEVLRQSGADIVGVQELAPDQGAAIAGLPIDGYPYQTLHPTGIPGKVLTFRWPAQECELLDQHPDQPDLQAIAAEAGDG